MQSVEGHYRQDLTRLADRKLVEEAKWRKKKLAKTKELLFELSCIANSEAAALEEVEVELRKRQSEADEVIEAARAELRKRQLEADEVIEAA
jgi:hypothetical protein